MSTSAVPAVQAEALPARHVRGAARLALAPAVQRHTPSPVPAN